jgi:pSer/pThr/pTyr-binding forkhead associated (FHA) protein
VKLIVLKNNVPLHEVVVDTADFDEMYEIYVGRSEDCHVQIDDPLISRHHFVLKNQNSNWYCEKLSQLGVVTLNGSVVSKNSVQDGDEVKCGVYSVIVSELPHFQKIEAKPVAPPVYVPEVKHEPVYIPQPVQPSIEDAVELEEESPLEAEDLSETLEDSPLEDDSLSLDDDSPLDTNDFTAGEILTEEPAQDFNSEGEGELASLSDFPSEGDEGGFAVTNAESEESTKFFKAFVNYQLVLFGEHAPYDRFQIDKDEIFIGRDPKKCQIILNDPEVSTVHAVIRKNLSEVTLEDLNSSNGTILNGERINKHVITTGDEFVIGGTSFTLEVKSDLLDSESGRLMPVETNQVIETEEIYEEEVAVNGDGDMSFEGEAVQEKSLIKRIWKDPVKRKKAIYVLAGLTLAWVLFSPDEQPAPETKEATSKEAPKVDPNAKPKKNLSKELENARNIAYELGVSFFEQSNYSQALVEFEKVVSIDSEYKKVQSYLEQTKIGLKRLKELEEQKRAEEDRLKTKKIVDELLVKAREAVKEKQVQVAESLFSQIVEKDPENIEVAQLKSELEAWQKEEERKSLERAAKDTARRKMVDALLPGKTFYLKKEWYRSILKLEEFLRLKNVDEDLIKEASEMLSDAKNQLASDLGPLIGKARSLKEGQDLKGAYEAFLDVLKVEPTNSEALNEVDDIKSQLDGRSKRIYREAIIAESLSLFTDAKEKFQEVQQISPTDSEYYKKASEKLKDYLE